MSKELTVMEEISSRVTDLGNRCREVAFTDMPLAGTGLGAIFDALLAFSDKQDDPGAIVIFEADALIGYVEFDEDVEVSENDRIEKAIELGQRISESCVSIGTVIENT
jgi:hypothetical protein